MEAFYHFQEEYQHAGGKVIANGFDNFRAFSNHPLATRKYDPEKQLRFEIKLDTRQVVLRKFSEENEYTFYPQRVRNAVRYKDFPIQQGARIQYEENILEKYLENGRITVSDVILTEGAGQAQTESRITLVQVAETDFLIPDFALEPESLWSRLSELTHGKDIDFITHQQFSNKYYLRGDSEEQIRNFFNNGIISFLESKEAVHIECHRNKLLFYKKRQLLQPNEIAALEKFVEEFLERIDQNVTQAV